MIKHEIKYLRSTSNGVEEKIETRKLTRSAGIKFHCLDCSGGYPTEVRNCEISTWPLWVFRPYQKQGSKPHQK